MSNGPVLTITDSVIRDNQPGGGGGPGCDFYDVSCAAWGAQGIGGALEIRSGDASISGSLFSENSAGASYGGAIAYSGSDFGVDANSLTIRNSTFVNNSAQAGGAIYHEGRRIDLGNLTFTGNTSLASSVGERSFVGGDVLRVIGTLVELRNLLMGGNGLGGADCVGGTVGSTYVNHGGLLADTGDTSCGADLFTGNPGLDPLADNGGFANSRALQAGSPAIDAGIASGCPTTDQRGVSRPQRGGCDIGAFELGALPVLTIDDPQGVPVGVARAFHVTTSYPAPLAYSWSVSGVAATIAGGTTASPTITFATQGTATVHVTAHDVAAENSLELGSTQRVVTVSPASNTGPSLTIDTTARTVDEGSTVAFSFTAGDAQGNPISYATGFPSCGAGGVATGTPTVSATGGTFSCRFPNGPATSSVNVQLADNFGARSPLRTIPVTVVDVAPIITITGDAAPDEGSTVSYGYTVVDPGIGDAAIGTVTTLCESTSAPWFSSTRFHKVDGSDTTGGSGTSIFGGFDCIFVDGPESGVARVSVPGASAERVIEVQNLAPTGTLTGPDDVEEYRTGVDYLFEFTMTDPSTWDTAQFDYPTASCGVLGRLIEFDYFEGIRCDFPYGPGTSVISLEIFDEDGARTTLTHPVTIHAIPPVIVGVEPQSRTTTEGSTVHFDFGVQDEGAGAVTFSVSPGCAIVPDSEWMFLDVRVIGIACTFPDGPGTVDRIFTATNAHGPSSFTLTETVSNIAPTISATLSPGVLLAGASATLTLGPVVDPGADTVSSWTVHWGDGTTSNGSGSPPSTLTHAYAAEGDYEVTVDLTDEDGAFPDVAPALEIVVETAPSFTLVPADRTEEATSAAGALSPYTVTASDVKDGAIVPVCTRAPASPGPEFPLGITTVSCVATDTAGYSATASFTVTVVDTTEPTLLGVPADQTIEAVSADGALAPYSVTATDAVDGTIVPSCTRTPASAGPEFPLGVTTVECRAADAAGNEAVESFTVTVEDTTDPAFAALANRSAVATSAAGIIIELLDRGERSRRRDDRGRLSPGIRLRLPGGHDDRELHGDRCEPQRGDGRLRGDCLSEAQACGRLPDGYRSRGVGRFGLRRADVDADPHADTDPRRAHSGFRDAHRLARGSGGVGSGRGPARHRRAERPAAVDPGPGVRRLGAVPPSLTGCLRLSGSRSASSTVRVPPSRGTG